MEYQRKFTVYVALILSGLLWLSSVGAAPPLPERGLLFELSRQGESVGYLFGTIHSEDPRVLNLPHPVSQAFDSSDRLVVEMALDASAMLLSMTSLVLSGERTLSEIIGEDLYRETVQAMQEIGIPESSTRRFKPWAVVTILSLPPPETGVFLDLALYNRAQQQGKPVSGLETAEEQLAVFDNLSDADQILLLKDALKTRKRMPILFESLLDAYLDRDLGRLMALSEESVTDEAAEAAKRFQIRALDERNRRMVTRLLPLLENGRAFVAVGALHLPGAEGLVNLLREQGFQVTALY